MNQDDISTGLYNHVPFNDVTDKEYYEYACGYCYNIFRSYYNDPKIFCSEKCEQECQQRHLRERELSRQKYLSNKIVELERVKIANAFRRKHTTCWPTLISILSILISLYVLFRV